MQIQNATKIELALLITGLRAIHISDCVKEHKKLLDQLETELSSRFCMRVNDDGKLVF